jgi:hypothetical protein
MGMGTGGLLLLGRWIDGLVSSELGYDFVGGSTAFGFGVRLVGLWWFGAKDFASSWLSWCFFEPGSQTNELTVQTF